MLGAEGCGAAMVFSAELAVMRPDSESLVCKITYNQMQVVWKEVEYGRDWNPEL